MWGIYAFNGLRVPTMACSGQFIAYNDINQQINIKFSRFLVCLDRGAQPKITKVLPSAPWYTGAKDATQTKK